MTTPAHSTGWLFGSCLLLTALLCSAEPTLALEVMTDVRIEHGTPRIDSGQGIAEITRMQAKGRYGAFHRASYGLGLFESGLTAEVALQPLPAATGTATASPARLAVSVRLATRPVIYVAREFAAGSCAQRAVLDHEWQHQRFDLEALSELREQLPRIANEVFGNALTDGTGTARAQARFLDRLRHAYDGMGFSLHGRIDNPESYGQFSEVCNGEISRLLAGNLTARPTAP